MRRVVGWAVFVAALGGLGALIHAGTPPTPRWSAHVGHPADANVARLSEDDTKLVLCPWATYIDPTEQPVRLIDVATGRVEATFPDGGPLTTVTCSASGRWVAAVRSSRTRGEMLHGLDTRSGGGWRLPLAQTQAWWLDFSPTDEHLLAVADCQQAHVIDPVAGRVVATLPCGRSQNRFLWAGRRLFHQRDIGGDAVVIWDGHVRATIPGVRYSFSVSTDGGRLLDGRLRLWDLSDPDRPALVAPLLSSPDVNPERCDAELTPDGRLAVVVLKKTDTAEIWDAITGRRLRACPLTLSWRWFGLIPGRPEVVVDGHALSKRLRTLHGLDLSAGRVAWSREVDVDYVLAPDGRAILLRSGDWMDDTVELTDVATGETLARWRGVCPGYPRARFEAGGRMVWLYGHETWEAAPAATLWERFKNWLRPSGEADALVGIGRATGRRVFELRNRRVRDHVVAHDGSFVLTFHDSEQGHVLCRWDLPVRKPWALAVGLPLVLGVGLLGLRVWWERSFRKKQPEGPAASGLPDD
jgi:hypothetical protein